MTGFTRRAALVLGALLAATACTPSRAAAPAPSPASLALFPGPKPAPPAPSVAVVGEYDCGSGVCLLIEDDGHLWLLDTATASPKRIPLWTMEFMTVADGPRNDGAPGARMLWFGPPSAGSPFPVKAGDIPIAHRNVGPREGETQLQVKPVRPVADVRVDALAASPPDEPRAARTPDLVELTALDPTNRLEVRYATTNNFLGTRFYDEARAFMQRPAALAVVRANGRLRPLGYGLLVHDAYRPWYVTKMFWDATPPDKRWLVANPAQGSKHNRGAAVDLTLYHLATGRAVEMPSTYDESTGRAFADYPGGTSLQRWHRALLRNAMVAEGFLVNPSEWWHFDYGTWRDYPLGNVAFDRIGR